MILNVNLKDPFTSPPKYNFFKTAAFNHCSYPSPILCTETSVFSRLAITIFSSCIPLFYKHVNGTLPRGCSDIVNPGEAFKE